MQSTLILESYMKNLDLFVDWHLMLSPAACSSTGVTYYADQLPKLVLVDFFDGDLKAYGVVKDWRDLNNLLARPNRSPNFGSVIVVASYQQR